MRNTPTILCPRPLPLTDPFMHLSCYTTAAWGGQVPLRHLPAKKGSVESGARRGVAAATGYARRDNVTTNLEPHISLVSLLSFLLSQYSYSE